MRERAHLHEAVGGGRGGGGGGAGAEVAFDTGPGAVDARENEWRDRYFQLVAHMREHDLLAPYAAERRANPLAEPPRLLAEACALYEAVYEEADRATRGQADPNYYTSFVWHMAGDLLLFVRKARQCRASDPSLALFTCSAV